jgi:hypothetical protein
MGFDIAIFVCDLPQGGENFRRVLEIPFDETVDLFVDADASRFRRRVLHPN